MRGYLTALIAIISILLGIYYYYPQDEVGKITISSTSSSRTIASSLTAGKVLNGLEILTQKSNKYNCSKIAVGYNANLDLIVKATDVLEKLKVGHTEEIKDYENLASVAQFQQTFLYWFEKGSAAERFVEREAFDKILKVSKNLPDHAKIWNIGGNAALMANRFAQEGCQPVLLGGQVGRTLSSMLSPKVSLVGGASGIEDVEEEVHLILEYERGAQWQGHEAPRANRFIIHSDTTNSKLEPLEGFHQALATYQPSLLVVSGLHLLEGQSAEFRSNRLRNVATTLKDVNQVPKQTLVHLELASMGDLSFVKQVATTVLPFIDSLGLNEQELGSAYTALGGKEFTRDMFKEPTVRTAIQALKFILNSTYEHHKPGIPHQLTRVHFHCLTFHLVLQKKGSNWGSAKQAVAAGSLATSEQACNSEKLDVEQVELLLPFKIEKGSSSEGTEQTIDPSDPALTFQEGNLDVCVTPVLVCKQPVRTVGLGDAISTMALVYQLYN